MDEIYLKIWEMGKPFYEKGRSYDVPHIEWMMKEADKIADIENLNKEMLLPIVILHDVGYATVNQDNPSIKDKKTKIIHMKEGAKIAKEILEKMDYNQNLIEKITYYISVHDNWILGDDSPYKECKEMAVFNDLDFLWTTTSFNIFKTQAKSMNYTLKEFYQSWKKDEKLTRRPFCCNYTKQMFFNSMEKINKAIN